jgi:muconate cycloisomerase
MSVVPASASVRFASAVVYAMRIPFRESFRHHLAERATSDSVIVKITSDTGAVGYGEGVPRPYVTGETLASCLEHIATVLLPAVLGKQVDSTHPALLLDVVGRHLATGERGDRQVQWHAARCAVELAMVDCVLRASGQSLVRLLPACVPAVAYTGVLSAGDMAQAERGARRMRDAGLMFAKIKVARLEDAAHVRRVREIVGPRVSLRVDANGAFDRNTALRFLLSLADVGLESMEQPVPRNDLAGLAGVRAASSVPVMVDESLVTRQDAERLIACQACDLFNLRISKCGGLLPTLELAMLAQTAGVGCQLGCQVGESAILSAAGRHLAAHLSSLRFVEGSYGEHLLSEDVTEGSIAFGRGGVAPLLAGPGLGIAVCDDRLARYAAEARVCTHE